MLNRPRWLVENGFMGRAQASLAYLRDADPTSDEVTIELEDIQSSVTAHKAAPESSWTVLFTHKPLFRRLWRAALLQFMAQMCGNTAMKYYLPSIFSSLGIEHRITLLISGIESTLKIGCTIIEMLIIDKVGRRTTLVVGCVVMSIALLVSKPSFHDSACLTLTVADKRCLAARIPEQHQPRSGLRLHCIHLLLHLRLLHRLRPRCLGLRLRGPLSCTPHGPNTDMANQIFPTNLRARGLNFAASGGAVGSIIAAQTWPVGMQNIGSKTYFVFMAINLVSAVVRTHIPRSDSSSLFSYVLLLLTSQ